MMGLESFGSLIGEVVEHATAIEHVAAGVLILGVINYSISNYAFFYKYRNRLLVGSTLSFALSIIATAALKGGWVQSPNGPDLLKILHPHVNYYCMMAFFLSLCGWVIGRIKGDPDKNVKAMQSSLDRIENLAIASEKDSRKALHEIESLLSQIIATTKNKNEAAYYIKRLRDVERALEDARELNVYKDRIIAEKDAVIVQLAALPKQEADLLAQNLGKTGQGVSGSIEIMIRVQYFLRGYQELQPVSHRFTLEKLEEILNDKRLEDIGTALETRSLLLKIDAADRNWAETFLLGVTNMHLGDMTEAEKHLQLALAKMPSISAVSPVVTANLHVYIMNAKRLMRHMDGVKVHAEKVLEYCKGHSVGERLLRAIAYERLAEACVDENYDQSKEYFEKFKEEADSVKPIHASYLLECMGDYASYIGECGRLIDSGEVLKNALAFADMHSVTGAMKASLLNKVAHNQYLKGHYGKTPQLFDEALINVQQAYDIAKQLDNKNLVQEIYNTIGNIHNGRGDYDEALKYHTWSYQLMQQMGIGYTHHVIPVLKNMAFDSQLMGEIKQANELYTLAFAIALEKCPGDKALLDKLREDISKTSGEPEFGT